MERYENTYINGYRERVIEREEREEREIYPYIPISLYERVRYIASSMKIPSRKRISYIVEQALSYVIDNPLAQDQFLHLAKSEHSNEKKKYIHIKVSPSLYKRARASIKIMDITKSKFITIVLEIYLNSLSSFNGRDKKTDDPDKKGGKVEKVFSQILEGLERRGMPIYDCGSIPEDVFNEVLESNGIKGYMAKYRWKLKLEDHGFIRAKSGKNGIRRIHIYTSGMNIPFFCRKIRNRKVRKVVLGILEGLNTDRLPYSIPRCVFDDIVRDEVGKSPLAYESVLQGMIDEGIIKYLDEKEVIFNVQTS